MNEQQWISDFVRQLSALRPHLSGQRLQAIGAIAWTTADGLAPGVVAFRYHRELEAADSGKSRAPTSGGTPDRRR
jgi:hypothetical protein